MWSQTCKLSEMIKQTTTGVWVCFLWQSVTINENQINFIYSIQQTFIKTVLLNLKINKCFPLNFLIAAVQRKNLCCPEWGVREERQGQETIAVDEYREGETQLGEKEQSEACGTVVARMYLTVWIYSSQEMVESPEPPINKGFKSRTELHHEVLCKERTAFWIVS